MANEDEETISFDDLPGEDEPGGTAREQLSQRVPCVEGKHHTFAPHESFCLCGALERGQLDEQDAETARLPWAIAVWPAAAVYAVRFSNYDPAEIDSIWSTKDKAEARAKDLRRKDGGWGWDVEEWKLDNV